MRSDVGEFDRTQAGANLWLADLATVIATRIPDVPDEFFSHSLPTRVGFRQRLASVLPRCIVLCVVEGRKNSSTKLARRGLESLTDGRHGLAQRRRVCLATIIRGKPTLGEGAILGLKELASVIASRILDVPYGC
ncbi:MAG: hypothetical protein ACK5TO_22335 [Planctomycetaceae bacterium]